MGEDEQRHRLVLLGAGKVGKSAIVQRFLTGSFPTTYKATIEDLFCKDYNVNGSVVNVDFLDTAGDLAFPAMRRLSISTAHALILVYAIDDMNSFEEVKNIWEQIKEQRSNYQELPCVIVANKCDLGDGRDCTTYIARDWAISEGLESSFMTVSAAENKRILNIFEKLLEQANIPQVRKLEPILKRRLSEKAPSVNKQREKFKDEESKLSRSRSLIRRASKPKVKPSSEPNKNDCVIC